MNSCTLHPEIKETNSCCNPKFIKEAESRWLDKIDASDLKPSQKADLKQLIARLASDTLQKMNQIRDCSGPQEELRRKCASLIDTFNLQAEKRSLEFSVYKVEKAKSHTALSKKKWPEAPVAKQNRDVQFPAKEALLQCLNNHPLFEDDQYLKEKGLIEQTAQAFAESTRTSAGVELGAAIVISDSPQIASLRPFAQAQIHLNIVTTLKDCAKITEEETK